MNKFLSRKFLLAAIGSISGISMAIIGSGQQYCIIIGCALSIICSVAYMIVEGVVDAKSAGNIVKNAVMITQSAKASKEVVDTVEKVGAAFVDAIGGEQDGS